MKNVRRPGNDDRPGAVMARRNHRRLALLAAVALIAATPINAAPANAAPDCPHFTLPRDNPDCYFLYEMAPMHPTASPDAQIAAAHTACGLMANSTAAEPFYDVAKMLMAADGSKATYHYAISFTTYAAAAYCPSYIR